MDDASNVDLLTGLEASLEATYAAMQAMAAPGVSDDSGSAAAAVASNTATTTAAANDTAGEIAALRSDMADMSSKLTAALTTIAGNTGRSAKTLDNVTNQSGGDAISIVSTR